MAAGMSTEISVALLIMALAHGGARAQDGKKPSFHDPLSTLAGELDEVGRQVLDAFPAYDARRIAGAIEALEARLGSEKAGPDDGYVLAIAYLELLVIHRFYERNAPDEMPPALARRDPDELSSRGIEVAEAYAAAHPEHSDIHRVRSELLSFQIHDMFSGMSKGPKARAALGEARTRDARNGWVLFAQARMHFHNPAFAGGDIDLALAELRGLSRAFEHFRVSLYLARTYLAKEMESQARYWAEKARTQAPANPEVQHFLRELDEKAKEAE